MTNNSTEKNDFINNLPKLFSKLGPNQGWSTFLILLGLILITGYSLREGTWVPTPGLMTIIFCSTTLGMIVSRTSPHWVISHAIGIITGAILCIHFVGNLTQEVLLIEKTYEILTRVDEWYSKISQGGMSQDTLPLSLAILALCWIMGFFGSWFTFKFSNAWLILLIAGIAILTNLSFLPEKFSNRFFIFMLFGLILLSQTQLFNKKTQWISSGYNFNKASGNLGLGIICAVAFLVVLASSSLPLTTVTNKNIIKIWNLGRSPISSFEEDFSRIFSVIDSKIGSGGRFFGDTLPFQGKIAFQNKRIATVKSENQNYWVSKIYNIYSNEGWMIGETSEISLPAFKKINDGTLKENQTYQNYEIETIFTTKSMLSTGTINQIDLDGSYQILAPMKFKINLYDNSEENNYLPEDIKKFTKNLKTQIYGKTEPEIQEIILNSIPKTVSLLSTFTSVDSNGNPALTSITLQRNQEGLPEVIGLNANKLIEPNQKYIVSSFMSSPSNDELYNTSEVFTPFITDHYLQLPPELPNRIKELSKSITKESDNQLDKVFAIRDHLRSGLYTYSQNISRPPLGQDGIDYFLFESQKGYSDYFGSAMVVMLRSLNIPARMVAGYSNGTISEKPMTWEIKDSDSHGWAQVYFNQFGWLNFEPTPSYPAIRQKPNLNETENSNQLALLQEQGVSNPQTNIECKNSETIMDESIGLGVENCDDEIFLERLKTVLLSQFSRNITITFFTILIIIVVLWYIWNEKYSKKSQIQIMYSKVKKLGRLAGLKKNKSQTPHEYSNALSKKIPNLSSEINSITTIYGRNTYGNNISDNNQKQNLEDIWKKFRKTILIYIIKKQFVK